MHPPRKFRTKSLGVMSMAGVLIAELLLVATYAALGDGSTLLILYTTLAVAVFTNLLLLLCMRWFNSYWTDVVAIFLIPTLVFFLMQIPLWGVRTCFRWTIVSPWSDPIEPRPIQFSLVHVFGWSAFLATPLCIIQGVLPVSPGSVGAILILTFCFWILMVSLLLMWIVYVALASNYGRLKLIGTTALLLSGAASTQVAFMDQFHGGSADEYVVLLITALNFAAGFVLLFCFGLAYRLGFRLQPFNAKRLKN